MHLYGGEGMGIGRSVEVGRGEGVVLGKMVSVMFSFFSVVFSHSQGRQ